MIFVSMMIVVVLLLLGVERLFRLKERGRTVLTAVYFTLVVANAIWSAVQNTGHSLAGFVIGFLDFAVPFVLWQWISSAIRNSRERRRRKTFQPSTEELATVSNQKGDTMGGKIASGIGYLLYGAFLLLLLGGWLQHLYTCFNEHYWGFLIAGAIFFPIAIIHGWGIWLGFWH